MHLRLRGALPVLRDPRMQWEIMRQLIPQRGLRRRVISLGSVQGEVECRVGDKNSDIIDLIKSRVANPTRGELDLIGELKTELSEYHTSRIERMNADLINLLSASDDLEKSSRYPREWFKPPQAVADQAARGLKYRKKYGRGGLSTQEAGRQGIGSGIQRANDLRAREYLSPKTITRMISFFARHRKHKNRRVNGEPAAGMIAWLLWGGDAGEKWALRVRDRMQRFDERVD